MWHQELPEMKAEVVVVVALLTFPIYDPKLLHRVLFLVVKQFCLTPFLSGLKQELVNQHLFQTTVNSRNSPRRLKCIQCSVGVWKCLRSLPTPILDKIPGPMEARFLSSVGLGFGTRIGRAQLVPTPTLDKNRFPR